MASGPQALWLLASIDVICHPRSKSPGFFELFWAPASDRASARLTPSVNVVSERSRLVLVARIRPPTTGEGFFIGHFSFLSDSALIVTSSPSSIWPFGSGSAAMLA